jgi:DNA-binding transcriptional LysR family regulator
LRKPRVSGPRVQGRVQGKPRWSSGASDGNLGDVEQWPGVEIRHLAALQAIDATRSFRGAADRLGYVQSAVSQQVSALEKLVGARLVERQRGHAAVRLTDAGAVLVQHAERILGHLAVARADLASLGSEREVLRVGVFESVATRIVPPALSWLRSHRPQVRVSTSEAAMDGELFSSVANGELDCAFADLPLLPGPFDAVELLVDPCVLVVPEDWSIARQDGPPQLEEIAQLPLAAHSWRFAELVAGRFREAGIELSSAFTFEKNRSAQALVSAGLSAAIFPKLSVAPDLAGARVIELDGCLPSRTVVVYWHHDRPRGPALPSFIDASEAVCREIDRERAAAAGTRVSRG